MNHGFAVLMSLGLVVVFIAACAPSPKVSSPDGAQAAAAVETAIPPPPFDWPSADATSGTTPTHHVSLLSFDWPDGLRIDVARMETTRTGLTAGAQPNRHRLSYVLNAAASAEGLRIFSSDVKLVFEGQDVSERVQTAFNKSIEELGPSMIPTFFVSPKGKFQRVESPAQVREDLVSMAALFANEQKTQVGSAQVSVSKTVDNTLTVDDITLRVANEWNSLVGIWSGLTLKDATPFPVSVPVPSGSASAEIALKSTGTAQFVGLVACEPGDVEKKCVALELKLASDPSALEKFLTARTSAAIAGASYSNKDLVKFESASLDYVARVVTEPDGLKPHRAQIVERLSMSMRILSQTVVPFTLQQETQYTFRYLSL